MRDQASQDAVCDCDLLLFPPTSAAVLVLELLRWPDRVIRERAGVIQFSLHAKSATIILLPGFDGG